jgi:hypothetical protein
MAVEKLADASESPSMAIEKLTDAWELLSIALEKLTAAPVREGGACQNWRDKGIFWS